MHFQGKLCWFLEQDSRDLNEMERGDIFTPLASFILPDFIL